MPFLPYDDAKQQQMKQQDERLIIKIETDRKNQPVRIIRNSENWKPRLRQMQCEECIYADIQTSRLPHKMVLTIWCKYTYKIVQYPYKMCPNRSEKPKKTLGDY